MEANEFIGLIHLLGRNWLLAITFTVAAWLIITRLVETKESLSKILGPLGDRMARRALERKQKYHQEIVAEAKQLATDIMPKVVPEDYGLVKKQLQNVIDRVDDLEMENTALREYVIYDEEWHFNVRLAYARTGTEPPLEGREHLTYDVFLERWKTGWRP